MLQCKLYDVEETAAARILLSISLQEIPSAKITAIFWSSINCKISVSKHAAC